MSLIIYAKPGTHAARYMRVKHRRKPPKAKDIVYCKDNNAEKHTPWGRFLVCEVKDVGEQTIYYLEWM